MPTSSARAHDRADVPPLPVRRFTVDEYHRMIDLGILTDEDQVELLEGWIVPKMPHNPPYDTIVAIAHNRVIGPRLPAGWFCRGQSAITTPDSEPEPDLAIIRGTERDYLRRHPAPKDMGLVIEVSDTTLRRDRNLKARLYARSGIPIYWIINLVDLRIEVHTDPSGSKAAPRYRQRRNFGTGRLLPLVLDGKEINRIPARELLP